MKVERGETARLSTHEMAGRNDELTKADDIQKKWLLMKETWLKGSKQVCGMTNGPPRHKETWWWLLLFAFRNLWKEWGDSNLQIFSQNCQFHHSGWSSWNILMCFYIYIYHSEHYGLLFRTYHIIFTRSPLFSFCLHFHFFLTYTLHLCYVFNII